MQAFPNEALRLFLSVPTMLSREVPQGQRIVVDACEIPTTRLHWSKPCFLSDETCFGRMVVEFLTSYYILRGVDEGSTHFRFMREISVTGQDWRKGYGFTGMNY